MTASPADEPGARELDRARPATAAARSPATRSPRTSARPRRPRPGQQRSATSATVTGLTNGTALHVHGDGDQRRRDRPRVAPSSAVTPAGHDLRLLAPAAGNVDSGDTLRSRARRQVHRRRQRLDHRRSASTRRRRTPARTSAACGPPSGSCSRQATFTNETASGWQTAYFSNPVPITAGTTYVACYYAPNGHYSVPMRRSTPLSTTRRCTRSRMAPAPTDLFSYGATSTFPTHRSTRATTGLMSCSQHHNHAPQPLRVPPTNRCDDQHALAMVALGLLRQHLRRFLISPHQSCDARAHRFNKPSPQRNSRRILLSPAAGPRAGFGASHKTTATKDHKQAVSPSPARPRNPVGRRAA